MHGSPRTIAEAWEVFLGLRSDRPVIFSPDPEDIDHAWRRMMLRPGTGPGSWTDAYLAAFARERSYSLVTFDIGFIRWTDLDLELLPPRDSLPV